MIDVVSCLTLEHDLRLVLLAAIICVGGSLTVVQLIRRAFQTGGMAKFAAIMVASIALGTTVWCTHFIAMLAYQAKAPVMLDPVFTLLSLMTPIFGFTLSLMVFVFRPGKIAPFVGGGLIGLCVAFMHYMGMNAYRVDGYVQWNTEYIAASVIASVVFCAAACYALCRNPEARFGVLPVALFTVGVVSLHFTGMTAMEVTPLALSGNALDDGSFIALSMATALAGILVIGTGGISFFLDADTRRMGYKKLLEMALTDTLTGLPNRNAHMQDLEQKLLISEDSKYKLAVIGIDLNRFKDINDTYGHKAGDLVLERVATAIGRDLRSGESVARLGGDEFAAAKLFSQREHLDDFLHKLEEGLKIKIPHDDAELTVGGSIGVAIYPDDGTSLDTLRNNADLAMYRAKMTGSHTTTFYEASMDEEVRARREISHALSKALEEDKLELHYQLQASVRTGEVSGMEALLRWNREGHGPVSPGVFIPIAEQSGLIVRLGEWVLKRACRDAATWSGGEKVAVNVSPLQLMQVELSQIIHQTLIETGLSPSRLEIELTETAILEDRDRSLHVLRQIKALGVGVALDDFGTGYSSLEILRSFPFDKIKLDRFFMTEIESSLESKALVRSVLSLGKSLSIPVLAEGVESEMQLQILREEGCDEVQGFLLGRPVSLDDLARQAKPKRLMTKALPVQSPRTAAAG